MNLQRAKSQLQFALLVLLATFAFSLHSERANAQCMPNAFAGGSVYGGAGGFGGGGGFNAGFAAGGYYGYGMPAANCYGLGNYYQGFQQPFGGFGYSGFSPMMYGRPSAMQSMFNAYGSGAIRESRSDGGSRRSRRSRDRDDDDYDSSSYSSRSSSYSRRLAEEAPPMYRPTVAQAPVVPQYRPNAGAQGAVVPQATAQGNGETPSGPAREPGMPENILPPGMYQTETALDSGPRPDSPLEATIACPTGDCSRPSAIPAELIEINRSLNANNRLARGARKAMAVIYQNCEALSTELPPGFAVDGAAANVDGWLQNNPRRYVNHTRAVASNPYLKQRYEGPQCRDRRRVYPTFHVGQGSKPSITRVGGKLQVDFNNERTNSSGGTMITTDCMGYLGASAAIAGTRLRASTNPQRAYQLGSAQLMALGTNSGEDVCVERVMFKDNTSIKPGDIAIWRNPDPKVVYGHAMIFERVGPDPFGLKDITSIAQCDAQNIKVDKWDFDVMQSSSMNGRLAASRLSAQALARASRSVGAYLIELARNACFTKFGAKEKYPNSECSSNEGAICYPAPGGQNKVGARILRHKENAPATCSDTPAKVKDEECVAGCERIDR